MKYLIILILLTACGSDKKNDDDDYTYEGELGDFDETDLPDDEIEEEASISLSCADRDRALAEAKEAYEDSLIVLNPSVDVSYAQQYNAQRGQYYAQSCDQIRLEYEGCQ